MNEEKVCKSKFGQIGIIFGQIWPCNFFFTGSNRKLLGAIAPENYPKNAHFQGHPITHFFFGKATLKTNPTHLLNFLFGTEKKNFTAKLGQNLIQIWTLQTYKECIKSLFQIVHLECL